MGRKILCQKTILHLVAPLSLNTTRRQSPSSCLVDLRHVMSPSSQAIQQDCPFKEEEFRQALDIFCAFSDPKR
eukprot:6677356-Ditylum_brightwellii.AAC.1